MPLSRRPEAEVMESADDASEYDSMDHSVVNRAFVDDLISNAPGNDALDLGTGTALIPIELCRRDSTYRVIAVDLAVSMLELARYNIEVAGITERIQLRHIDAKKMPFTDAMFSVVMSNSIVHHIPDPLTVLIDAVRVTRVGGLLFFRDLARPDTEDESDCLVDKYTEGSNNHQKQMFKNSLHAALSLDEIRLLVTKLGFRSDTVNLTSDRHWTWCARKGADSELAWV